MKYLIVATALMLMQLPAAAVASVTVLDGDTLKLNGQSVRLQGIDAPETGQLCKTKSGGNWFAVSGFNAHIMSTTSTDALSVFVTRMVWS